MQLHVKSFIPARQDLSFVGRLPLQIIVHCLGKWYLLSLTLLFFKVPCVVNIKLFFEDWFYYNLIILINAKSNKKNLNKAPLFSRNQVYCLKTLKLWGAPAVQYFLLKLHPRFILTNVYKRICRIFLFRFCIYKN